MAMAPMAVMGANVVVNVDGRESLMCASLETKRRTSLWRGRARGKKRSGVVSHQRMHPEQVMDTRRQTRRQTDSRTTQERLGVAVGG